jgi:formylglycine-generating enzyme required for sulfatase activity
MRINQFSGGVMSVRAVLIHLPLLLWACLMLEVGVQAESAPEHPEMVYFPAGEFLMGSPESVGQRDEHPRHLVRLDAFWLDRYEVSGKDFERYLDANPEEHPTITGWVDRKIRPDMAERPVFGLRWERCFKYCVWCGKRIPSEAEWERAAAGVDQRIYPWGDAPPDADHANFNKCCFIQDGKVLAPVSGYDAGKTPEGIYHMAGNVGEWVFDWYDENYYKASETENPLGPSRGKYHVIRGGAWNSGANYMRSADRYGYNDANDFYGIGCRCAKSALATDAGHTR